MKKYRLKKEVVPFIKDKYATSIHPLDTWDSLNVDINALEEVEPAYLSYGFKEREYSSLCGWNEKGSEFHFTIHFPSIKFNEHDNFSKGESVRELMNRIQEQVNHYYDQFKTSKQP